MIAAAVLAALGWLGLLLLLNTTLPTIGPRWLFFFLLTQAATGTALPFVWFLRRRFGGEASPPVVLLREALWVGLYASVCAWLQINRSLSLTVSAIPGPGAGRHRGIRPARRAQHVETETVTPAPSTPLSREPQA